MNRQRSQRRSLLRWLAGTSLARAGLGVGALLAPWHAGAAPGSPEGRSRPGDPSWPTADDWQGLRTAVGDAFLPIKSPWPACVAAPAAPACAQLFAELNNPYFIGDDPALTQTLGWVGAWTSAPSAVRGRRPAHRGRRRGGELRPQHRLRLVVKGGGHSYQGTSNAADSLLVWTRRMNDIALHDAFVAERLRRTRRADARRHGRRRRDLGARLRRGHDARRPLCPGRRLHDGRRRRAGAERRLRQLLEGATARPRQACSRPRS